MKKGIFSALLVGFISIPAFAESVSDWDAAHMVFEANASQPMELAVLSSEEMKNTEGAWVPYAIGAGVGFVTGNYSYLVNAAFDPNFNWSLDSYVRSVGTSTVVGAINPVSSIASVARAAGSSFLTAWQFR